MALGIIGRKLGMTRLFTEDGVSVPVTVIEATKNRVTQIKTKENDGYCAVQVTAGERRPSRVTRPMAGHFAKAASRAGSTVGEFRVDSESELSGLEVGHEIGVDRFSEVKIVNVTGTTIGKGFQGTVKRHHFRTKDMTHGNSLSHRTPGSIGQRQTPGRVFKGKPMSGHMGATQVTTTNLELARVDVERSLLLIKGAVPGPVGGLIVVKPKQIAKKG